MPTPLPDWSPLDNPLTQVSSVFRDKTGLTQGRYLVNWERAGVVALREAYVAEISPTGLKARVVWTVNPIDQEWLCSRKFYEALEEVLAVDVSGGPFGLIPGDTQPARTRQPY